MVALIYQHLHLLSFPALSKSKSRTNSSVSCSMNSSSNPQRWTQNLLKFAHVSPSHRSLMFDLLSAIDTRLGHSLLPSSISPDIACFENEPKTSQGSIDIRSGQNDSAVDFILASWLHCQLPFGSLDITTIFAFLKSSTDAPHLLLEFIQPNPKSLILFMDLLPRKDLVLHPDYLQTFYEETQLERQRQVLEKVKQTQPYLSSSLYIRSVLSPTAIAVSMNCDEVSEMEDVMRDRVGVVAKEVVRVWLDGCSLTREIGEAEKESLAKRDELVKSKTLEIDLAANLPRLFGAEIAAKIMGAIQKAYGIESK